MVKKMEVKQAGSPAVEVGIRQTCVGFQLGRRGDKGA